jgi:hypothetical protein
MSRQPVVAPLLKDMVQKTTRKRKRKRRELQQLANSEWTMLDLEKVRLRFDSLDDPHATACLAFKADATLVDIFMKLCPPAFIQTLIDVDSRRFHFSRGKSMNVTIPLIYKCLAVFFRIQAQHTRGERRSSIKEPQRRAFNEAISHFHTSFPKAHVPGLSVLECIHLQFLITPEYEETMSLNLQSCVRWLGQWMAGDEKLIGYTGNSGYIRAVQSKPDQVGIWMYEGTVRLRNGLPFLVYSRTHDSHTQINRSVHTAEIMGDWADLVVRKGQEQTILVADSYYLDNTGHDLICDYGVKYLCAIQKTRFESACVVLQDHVTKPGDFAIATNEEGEMVTLCWDINTNLGKKYCMSNAFYDVSGRNNVNEVPMYDCYKHMFSVCDRFNKSLHNHMWPFRHGGMHSRGDLRLISDFHFSAFLINVLHAHANLSNTTLDEVNYEDTVLQLSHDLFAKACTL